VRRRVQVGDRPPIPAELLSTSHPAWYDADEEVPAGYDASAENRWAWRSVRAWGRWRDARDRWSADNGYTSREMHEAYEAAQGSVDRPPRNV